MNMPICESCSATQMLCSGCLEKQRVGEITDADVRLAYAIHKNRGDLPDQQTGFEKVIAFPSLYVVFTQTPASLIGKGGRVVNKLKQELGVKKIKVISMQASLEEKISEILLPVKLLGVNTIFKPGGKEYKIRVPRSQALQLPTDLQALCAIFTQLLGARTIIAFE